MMAESVAESVAGGAVVETKRDFLKILTIATGSVAVAAIAWPFVDALNPGQDAAARENPIVEVGGIAPDTAISYNWNGLPVLIRKLTDQQIIDAQAVVPASLPDPADFTARVHPGYEHFVVVIGINTAAPCQLLGNDPADPRGAFGGWTAPCDGSVYDVLGRVRSGPAQRNLAIPRFTFLNDTQIQFG